MDYNRIKELLERYWEGETSLEEEAQLTAYFQQETIPAELERFRALFQFFGTEKTKVSQRKTTVLPRPVVSSRKTRWMRRLAVAASIVAVATIGLVQYNNQWGTPSTNVLAEDTYKDPDLAYQEAKAALLLVAKKLNKGIDKSREGIKKVPR